LLVLFIDLIFGILPMVSPLHYSTLLSSLDLELDRLRLAFAASECLSSIRTWRYVVTRYAPHGKLSWLDVFNVCGLEYPRSVVKSMSDDPTRRIICVVY